MAASPEKIREFLQSPDWTEDEKRVIEWQFGLCGDFKQALWGAIKRADQENLRKLALGFPDEVIGYLAWTQADLGDKLRKAGLDI